MKLKPTILKGVDASIFKIQRFQDKDGYKEMDIPHHPLPHSYMDYEILESELYE